MERYQIDSSRQTSESKFRNLSNNHIQYGMALGPMSIDELNNDNNNYTYNRHLETDLDRVGGGIITTEGDGHNTPRFSQRMNMQKEMRYKDAVEMINEKRKKKEQKKQLYNSLTGKS